ncbi:hypothetical protein IMSAGC007_03671 [Lachnospiraceae bacterium]|nr:hypothetical protein IMSAGC007_03671 [Lachnospiraceae bacterium]
MEYSIDLSSIQNVFLHVFAAAAANLLENLEIFKKSD